MRVVCNKKGLPRHWKRQWPSYIIAETDLKVSPHSKLRAKLLIFEHQFDLRKFWKKFLNGSDLGKRCIGCVNGLSTEHRKYRKDKSEDSFLEVDPLYFCVIGLIRGIDSVRKRSAVEYITHEAVHAAFCYEKRRKGNIFCEPGDSDEESICYPAGRIARQINVFLHENGLY